jgi:CxxC-x17-CxxC domain-containing protein
MDVMAGLVAKLENHLISLERKIDILINQSSAKAQEKHNDQRGSSFRERNLHKAICADCRKECEIPFKPSPNRPVYCNECFAKRKKGGNIYKETDDARPADRQRALTHEIIHKPFKQKRRTGRG